MRRMVLPVLACLVGLAAGVAIAEEGAKSLDAAWVKAMKANDVDAVVALYATDAVLWLPDAPEARGEKAIRATYAGLLAANTVVDASLSNGVYHPWGDVSTAYHSTGIPHIEVYLAAPPTMRLAMRATRIFAPVLSSGPVRRFLAARLKARPAGPTDEQRARGRSRIYAEAIAGDGRRAAALLEGPEGYTLTAMTAVHAVEKLAAGSVAAGFATPSRAFGADFILEIPGVTRRDL